jgi:hypothetical protein
MKKRQALSREGLPFSVIQPAPDQVGGVSISDSACSVAMLA